MTTRPSHRSIAGTPATPDLQSPAMDHGRGHSVAQSLRSITCALLGIAYVSAQGPLSPSGSNTEYTIPDGDFEHSTSTYVTLSPGSWQFWTFAASSGSSGISADNSSLTSSNLSAPNGSHVAFLQGSGSSISNIVNFSFSGATPPGIWRVRFSAAQRVVSGVPENQTVRVSLGGTDLFHEPIRRSVYDQYVTRPITVAAGNQTIVIASNGAGTAFIDDVRLESVLDWDDTTNTWAGTSPTGHDVVIPAGVAVAVGVSATAKTVEVKGELLATMRTCALTTEWVMVTDKGVLEVGTAGCPFLQTFTLTLASTDYAAMATPGMGTKFLVAMDGGRIDLHGKPKVSWVKLTQTAQNTTQLYVDQSVDWTNGDQIVIAPSFAHTDAQVCSVSSVSGQTVTLQAATSSNKTHYGGANVTYSRSTPTALSWDLDRRAEVGLLTHNVRVVGAVDGDYPQFGGHIMIMHCSNCNDGPGFGRLSNVELENLGQGRVADGDSYAFSGKGRYPIHWHMCMDTRKTEPNYSPNNPNLVVRTEQYIRNCSIHNSNNRAVTIHGSDYVLVQDNVAYKHVGHGVFLEDGPEQGNAIERNLVIETLKPDTGLSVIPTDSSHAEPQNRSPASFWLSNPYNKVSGNVAAGTVGTGFWLVFHHELTGPSLNDPLMTTYRTNLYHPASPPAPRELPFIEFKDNVAHTCGSGLDINDSVNSNLTLLPNVGWLPPTPQTIENFRAYACSQSLYAGVGTDKVTFLNNVLSDSKSEHVLFATPHSVKKSLLIRDAGGGFITSSDTLARAITLYDGPTRMKNCHLVAYAGNNQFYLTHIHLVGAAVRRVNHTFEGISFDTMPNWNIFVIPNTYNGPGTGPGSRDWSMVLWDPDGSLGGTTNRSIILDQPMLRDTGDTSETAVPTSSNYGVPLYLSRHKFGLLLIHHTGFTQTTAPHTLPKITYTRNDGSTSPPQYPNSDKADPRLQIAVWTEASHYSGNNYYDLSWDWGTLTPTSPIDVQLGDLGVHQGGMVVLKLQINPGTAYSSLTVTDGTTTLTPYSDTGTGTNGFNGTQARSETSYTVVGTDVWLRIIVPADEKTIRIAWT